MTYLKKNGLWLVVNLIITVIFVSICVTIGQQIINPTIATVVDEGRRSHSALGGAVKESGEWAIRLLVLSLSCTPLFVLFGWTWIMGFRKATGVWAFFYTAIHLLAFGLEKGWLASVGEFNFIMGWISLLIMLPLALTSTDWAMQLLRKNWRPLQRAAYAAGVFAVLHLLFLGEGAVMMYGTLMGLGFIIRIPQVRKAIHHYRGQHLSQKPALGS